MFMRSWIWQACSSLHERERIPSGVQTEHVVAGTGWSVGGQAHRDAEVPIVIAQVGLFAQIVASYIIGPDTLLAALHAIRSTVAAAFGAV